MSDPYRDACRREHRLIGHYLAVQAWIRGLDCVVLMRHDLEALFELERFKSARVQWLLQDLNPWFPEQKAYYRLRAPSSIESLFLSRAPIDSFLPKESMRTEARIKGMSPSAPKTERFTSTYSKKDVPTKEAILSFLALLDAGLIDPNQYKPKN
jgi:hypothetical protein